MFLLVGVSVRAVMESAVESGYKVTGVDFFGDMDSQWQGKTIGLVDDLNLSPTVENLLRVAQEIPCEGLVYVSGPENHPDKLTPWDEQGLLCGNRVEVLKQVRDPWQVQKALAAAEIGVNMPRFYTVGQWRSEWITRRWLLKPLHRGGGHGITELAQDKRAAQWQIAHIFGAKEYIVQEFVAGISASVTFLANGRETVLLGMSRQLTGLDGAESRPFVYAGNIVPLDPGLLGEGGAEKLDQLTTYLTVFFGLRGINTLDFILNAEGIWVLELNPRWSASVELIEKWRGQSFFSLHVAASQGHEPLSKEEVHRQLGLGGRLSGYWGKRIIYAGRDLVIKGTLEPDYHSLYARGLRDIPKAGGKIARGEPICTVVAGAGSDGLCEEALERKVQWARAVFGDR